MGSLGRKETRFALLLHTIAPLYGENTQQEQYNVTLKNDPLTRALPIPVNEKLSIRGFTFSWSISSSDGDDEELDGVDDGAGDDEAGCLLEFGEEGGEGERRQHAPFFHNTAT